jgi:hypothetical protein
MTAAQADSLDGLKQAISDFSVLKVAEFQRNYDWDRQNVEELWSDLIEAVEGGQPHFFGTLIFEVSEDSSHNRPTAQIVDGQQRLTTLRILFARLRDELARLGSDSAIFTADGRKQNVENSIRQIIGIGDSEGTEFVPGPLIREEYKEILKEPSYESDKNDFEGRSLRERMDSAKHGASLSLRSNYFLLKKLVRAYLDSKTADLSPEEAIVRKRHLIFELRECLFFQFKVLVITTRDQAQSLDIFLVTNDRGLELGAFDLVRGQILQALAAESKSEKDRKRIFEDSLDDWAKIAELVGSTSSIDQFLRQWLHLRPERRTITSSGTKLERVTKRRVPDVTDTFINRGVKSERAARARELWEDIQLGAGVFTEVLNPRSDELGAATALRLRGLNSAGKSYRILAMKALDPRLGLARASKETMVRMLCRLVLRWLISGSNAQELETGLQIIAFELTGDSSVPTVQSYMEEFSSHLQVDASTYVQNGVGLEFARAVLLILEAEKHGKAGMLERYELEHIAPNSGTSEWRETLQLRGKEYTRKVNEIGNLLLLDKELNRDVKQKQYFEKRESYRDSNVLSARELATRFDNWGVSDIDARTHQLVSELNTFLH